MKKSFAMIAIASIVVSGSIYTASGEISEKYVLAAEAVKPKISTSNFDHSKKLSQTEKEILVDLKVHQGIQITNTLSSDFYNALARYENPTQEQMKNNRSQAFEFMNFATLYRSYLSPYQDDDETSSTYAAAQKSLLNKTYEQIRAKNLKTIQQGKLNAQIASMQSTSSNSYWNESLATSYALQYAVNPNSAYRVFSDDCTNFASQIALAGGASFDYGSEIPWYYSNGLAYSRSWTVAQDFVDYWVQLKGARVQQYETQVDLILGVNPGDFIGFILDDTLVLNHIAYCDRKADGGAYISEHTSNLADVSLASRDVSQFGSFISFHIN